MSAEFGPLWPAPTASDPVRAEVRIPGSKSLTNRVLVLAALGDTSVDIRRPLRARDSMLMVSALEALGAEVRQGDDRWTLTPGPFQGGATIDCGLAGTVMRFAPPVAAMADAPVHFDGDSRARKRPMRPVLDGLRQLGVEVEGDLLPVTVHGAGRVRGGEVTVDASGSSQFVSALLLAGCRYEGGLTVHHAGKALPSAPHIEMTMAGLRDSGVPASAIGPASWRVEPAVPSAPGGYDVEPDLSNAGVFLAAALVTGGTVTVPAWPTHTAQPGDLLRRYLAALGARVELQDGGLTVTGTGAITGTDLDLSPAGELAPVLVALLALADAPSVVSGIAHLRGHETDRLAALAREINRLGGDVTETADGLAIRPRPLHGGVFHTYADHRMAHAGAVLGLAVPDVLIEDIATTGKTLPDFPGQWDAMLAGGTLP